VTGNPIVPAGWATRHFSLAELDELYSECNPKLIEISKDLADAVSLKALGQTLDGLRDRTGAALAFAGTSDLVSCAGIPWPRYHLYLGVQFAQARSLGCSWFRLLLGNAAAGVVMTEFIQRVRQVCVDLAPITPCFEVHGGIESDPAVLQELVQATPAKVVVDFENLQRAQLSADHLLAIVPPQRIAYFHQRNLPSVWTEHAPSLPDEARWHALLPETPFLWEPKAVEDPDRIKELFCEYRRSH